MSHPYKPQARLDRDLLRHLHRSLACGSAHPTPLPNERYGAWHARMTKDLEQCRAEEAEQWRKENGPWHAHEIKEWMDQLRGQGSDLAGSGLHTGAGENVGVRTAPTGVPASGGLSAANPHGASAPSGGAGCPAHSVPQSLDPHTGLAYPQGSMPPPMVGANSHGSGTVPTGVTHRGQNFDDEI